jgi:hypothetical protein
VLPADQQGGNADPPERTETRREPAIADEPPNAWATMRTHARGGTMTEQPAARTKASTASQPAAKMTPEAALARHIEWLEFALAAARSEETWRAGRLEKATKRNRDRRATRLVEVRDEIEELSALLAAIRDLQRRSARPAATKPAATKRPPAKASGTTRKPATAKPATRRPAARTAATGTTRRTSAATGAKPTTTRRPRKPPTPPAPPSAA